MPFSKRKPGRSPLQRLSDQRRSLALAGLAVGAVFSAAFFRRKRRGGEVEFERPTPPPTAQPESGLPAAVEVPQPAASEAEVLAATDSQREAPATAASRPEGSAASASTATAINDSAAGGSTASTETAINAAPDAETAPEAAHPASFDPPTGELSAEEASILAVLAQSGRTDDDRTAIAVATSLERETTDVTAVLRKLGTEGVVSGELYTAAGDKIWAVTERGVRRLGAQS